MLLVGPPGTGKTLLARAVAGVRVDRFAMRFHNNRSGDELVQILIEIPKKLTEKQKHLLRERLQQHNPDFKWEERLIFSEHHLSHAASAYYPSPFERAAALRDARRPTGRGQLQLQDHAEAPRVRTRVPLPLPGVAAGPGPRRAGRSAGHLRPPAAAS